MTYYVGNMPVGEHLTHYGTKGMKWGHRRYQNPDGSLTAAGQARYNRYTSGAGRSSNPNKSRNLRRAAAIAGGVALGAGAAYLGYRNRGAIKGLAKNIGSRVRNSARTPWYARGVEGGVRRNAAKAEAATARANAKRQVNSAFAGEGLAIRKHSKVGDAFKRVSMNAGYYTGKAKNAANNAAGSAKRAYYKAKKGVKDHAKNRVKAGRYPGWVKDTAKSYAGAAKRTADKAKDKAKATAKKYNDYMNSPSKHVRSYGLKYDHSTGRPEFKTNYWTRREYARKMGKEAGVTFAPLAAGYASQKAYDKYGKNPILKSNSWRKKHGYKTDIYGNRYRQKKSRK